MTDKQIIIDGVDIKDCKRRIGKDNFCRYYKRPCAENNYNCIWKKYLRKEQEYERLTRDYFKQNEWFKEQKKELDQLKGENDTYKKMFEDEDVRLALIEIRSGERHLWFNKAEKLKQTLTVIKEMCNSEVCDYIQCSLNYNHSEDFECEKTSCGRVHRRKFILDILQKISEVENEN